MAWTKRDRVLDLDELRDVWQALDDERFSDNYRAFIRHRRCC